jgi:hypothetical protein
MYLRLNAGAAASLISKNMSRRTHGNSARNKGENVQSVLHDQTGGTANVRSLIARLWRDQGKVQQSRELLASGLRVVH